MIRLSKVPQSFVLLLRPFSPTPFFPAILADENEAQPRAPRLSESIDASTKCYLLLGTTNLTEKNTHRGRMKDASLPDKCQTPLLLLHHVRAHCPVSHWHDVTEVVPAGACAHFGQVGHLKATLSRRVRGEWGRKEWGEVSFTQKDLQTFIQQRQQPMS